jgi:HD-GYP domain-containing protein (c-di-GMP phosphodiesterase class II)
MDARFLRSASHPYDIGKVAGCYCSVPSSLDAEEFREMRDHTVVGHQIASSSFWPQIPEIVRWHHERGDGTATQTECTRKSAPAVRIVAR